MSSQRSLRRGIGALVVAAGTVAGTASLPIGAHATTARPAVAHVSVSSKYGVTATVPVGNTPTAVAVDPVSHKVYAANDVDSSVTVINGATDKVLRTVVIGNSPQDIAIDAKTGLAWIANFQGHSVSELDTVNDHALGYADTSDGTSITSGTAPSHVAIDPGAQHVFVTDSYPGVDQLSEISEGSASLVRDNTIVDHNNGPTGAQPHGIALDLHRHLVFTANTGDDSLSVISANGSVLHNINLEQYGADPEAVYFDSDTNRLFVSMWSVAGATGDDARNGQVLVLNGSTFKKVATIPTDIDPSSIAADPADHVIFIANQGSGQGGLADPGTLTIVNDDTLKLEQTLKVGLTTVGVAVDPSTHTVYAVNSRSNDVSVVNLLISSGPGTIGFGSSSYSVVAGSKATIAVIRTGDTNLTSTVKYAATSGSAKSEKDFKKAHGTLTFSKGERIKTFSIKTIGAKTKKNKTVRLELSKPSGGTLKAPKTATLTIHERAGAQLTSVPPSVTTDTTKAYKFTLTATGRPKPTFALASGALPKGLKLSKSGVLAGKPQVGGVFTFRVKSSNGVGSASASGPINLTIYSPVKFVNPPTTLTATANQPWLGANYPISAFPNYNITWSVVGSLPPGVSTNSGELFGTPTTDGTYTFKLSAENIVAPAATTPTITMTVTG
jgi:YVTN family beta-propeller protein